MANIETEEYVDITTGYDDLIQTKWACQKLGHQPDAKYVIARKDINTGAQCAKLDGGNTCVQFDNLDACQVSMANSDVISPYQCSQNDINDQNSPCGYINTNLFQCFKTGDNEYMGLRLNKDRDVECLGNNAMTCLTFDSLVYCNEGLGHVRNDEYLACGAMLSQLYGVDGYSDPNHYCSKFKKVLSEPPKILPKDIDVVRGWAGNHENPGDKDQKPEDCRQKALNSGGKYVAWGHRNMNHQDPNLRNTCFLYTKGFAPFSGNPDDNVNTSGCLRPGDLVSKGCTQFTTNVQDMAGKAISISHPDGRVWKNNENVVKLNSGTPMRLMLYSSNDVYGNPNRFGLIQDNDKNLAIRHSGWVLFVHPFVSNNYDFAWSFVPVGSGVRIYNDYEKTWVGYNDVGDSLIICNADDPKIVNWNIAIL